MRKVSILKIAEIFLIIFLLYITWFAEAFIKSNLILYGTAGIATLCIVFDIIKKRHFRLSHSSILRMYMWFGIYSFLSGLIIAQDKNIFFDSMLSYFSFFIVLYDCYYVSEHKGSMEWIGSTLLFSAILCVLKVLIAGRQYDNWIIVTTMSPHNNPNTLGMMMIAGIFFLTHNRDKLLHWFFGKMILVLAFLYVIVLSGSKKCLIAGFILILFWMLSYIRNEFSTRMRLKRFLSFLVIFLGIGAAVIYFVNFFSDTPIFTRFVLFFTENGSKSRLEFYSEAFDIWKQHPIFGAGYFQFMVLNSRGMYSHSTYAEILSCSGIVGCLIFFIPIIRLGIRLIKNVFDKSKKEMKYNNQMLLIIFVVELLMGAVQIWYYDFLHLFIFLYLAWRAENPDTDKAVLEGGICNV